MLAKHTLYQLSYTPFIYKYLRTMRVELIHFAWKAKNLPLIYTRYKDEKIKIFAYQHNRLKEDKHLDGPIRTNF